MIVPRPQEQLRAMAQQFCRPMGPVPVREVPCGQSVSIPRAHVLTFLLEWPTDVVLPVQQDLAGHLGVDKKTIHRLLGKMRAGGLVREGRHLASQLHRSSCAFFARVLGHLPADRRWELGHAAERLNQAIGQLK